MPFCRPFARGRERAGVRRLIPAPMFPSYLFVRHAIEKRSYLDIMSTRGLVRILGERWDRLRRSRTPEIDAIQRLGHSDLALLPYPYLREGQRVRIVDGALAGVEGILVRNKTSRGLLVISVNLLNRSVAVEMDCAAVVPVETAYAVGLHETQYPGVASPCF